MKKWTKDEFARFRVGLFVTYGYHTYDESKGTNFGGTGRSRIDLRGADSAEEAAAMLDGQKLAETAHTLGAQYVVFSLAHAGFNLLYPSELMKATGCTHKCAEKSDAIQKLLDGLEPYGIPLVLYLPPNDAHDIPGDDLARMGWVSDEARMDFLVKLVKEIDARYHKAIAGFWFDQFGPQKCVCDAVRECNPNAVIFINMGGEANEEKPPLADFIVSECGSITSGTSDSTPVHFSQANRQVTHWYPVGCILPVNAIGAYRYTVRTIAVEGQFNCGVAWSCGPYIDQTWEYGVEEMFSDLGKLLRGHEGIYGTVPGVSYPEAPKSVLKGTDWGVSTELEDGSVVYLHVLNRPADGAIHLPAAKDGKVFARAEYVNLTLPLTREGDGWCITLPEKNQCDRIDTVVRLIPQ